MGEEEGTRMAFMTLRRVGEGITAGLREGKYANRGGQGNTDLCRVWLVRRSIVGM